MDADAVEGETAVEEGGIISSLCMQADKATGRLGLNDDDFAANTMCCACRGNDLSNEVLR